MLKAVKFAAVFVAAISTLAIASLFMGKPTYAASDIPVEIIPRCSSAAYGVSYYEVQNKNDEAVSIDYHNLANDDKGTFSATPGQSALYVKYDASDPNNTTSFIYQHMQTQTNANVGTRCTADQLPSEPTTPVTDDCTDATNASNLHVKWLNDSQITVYTDMPICNTVDLFYSTYKMPDNYDGKGFYLSDGSVNPTAVGQTGQASYEFILAKDSYGTKLENVPAPDYCSNIQADLYYGPEVTNIGNDGLGYYATGDHVPTDANAPAGHGTKNIASVIFTRDADKCNPGQGGGNGGCETTPGNGGGDTNPGDNGGGSTTPPAGQGGGDTTTPSTPVTTATSTPTVLPDTGAADLSTNVLSAVLTAIFGGVSLMAIGLRTLRA